MIMCFCEAGWGKLLISSWLRQAPQFHGKNRKKIKAAQVL
jgi:hypothetical protein